MGTYTLSFSGPTRDIHTNQWREILRFPVCYIPANAITITNISLRVTMRYGQYSSSKVLSSNFKLSPTCNTMSSALTGWKDYLSSNNVYYQTTGTAATYFDASHWSLHFPSSTLLLDQTSPDFKVSATGNQAYTFSFVPTTYGQNPANWRGKNIWLGGYKVNDTFSSPKELLWGSNTNDFSITFTYTENTPPTGVSAINYPAANSTYTYNTKPWFRATLGTDPDAGDQLQLGWAIYDNTNSTWPISTVWDSTYRNGGAVVDWQCTTALTRGHTYTLYCYQRDKAGVETSDQSAKPQRSFIVGTPFGAVSSGSLIDDGVADSAQSQINNLRAYYGMSTTSFTTINAGTTLDDAHIDQMETALEATPHVGDITTVNSPNKCVPADMNNLRNALLNG